MYEMLGSSGLKTLADPKSHSFSWCVVVSTSRVCGLMSRWHTPLLWMFANARAIWYVYSLTYRLGTLCALLL